MIPDEEALPCHAESDSECRERDRAVEELRTRIQEGKDAEEALWQAVLAYQNYPLHTSSGLPFSYTVKCNKKGEYSGELLVSRKEGSKTLTKSSIMLAFRIVLEEIETKPALVFPEYKGPKAIGQIFGISYVYSLFWRLGLIRVPEKVEAKLNSR